MAPTNDLELRQYLNSKDIPCSEVEVLTGGTANYVWRIRTLLGRSSVVKHAEPYVKENRTFRFPVVRMDFEAKALEELPGKLARSGEDMDNDKGIILPAFINYDPEAHVITMGDGGSRTLKSAYIKDKTLNVASLGKKIGEWLAHLHSCTCILSDRASYRAGFDNEVAKSVYRYCYEGLATAFESNGFDKTLGERVNEKYGSLLVSDDVCLCHGDFWPGNILLSDHVDTKNTVLTVVDWEMVRNGEGATDVGQFAAEAWLLDRFHGGRGLLTAFLKGYSESRKLERVSAIRTAVHYGTHLGFWPTRVDWVSKEETKELVGYGYRILKAIEDEDWGFLKGSDVGLLFED